MVWFQILHDITDYDIIKIRDILNMNHQTIFSHIIMVSRRNQKINNEMKKAHRKK